MSCKPGIDIDSNKIPHLIDEKYKEFRQNMSCSNFEKENSINQKCISTKIKNNKSKLSEIKPLPIIRNPFCFLYDDEPNEDQITKYEDFQNKTGYFILNNVQKFPIKIENESSFYLFFEHALKIFFMNRYLFDAVFLFFKVKNCGKDFFYINSQKIYIKEIIKNIFEFKYEDYLNNQKYPLFIFLNSKCFKISQKNLKLNLPKLPFFYSLSSKNYFKSFIDNSNCFLSISDLIDKKNDAIYLNNLYSLYKKNEITIIFKNFKDLIYLRNIYNNLGANNAFYLNKEGIESMKLNMEKITKFPNKIKSPNFLLNPLKIIYEDDKFRDIVDMEKMKKKYHNCPDDFMVHNLINSQSQKLVFNTKKFYQYLDKYFKIMKDNIKLYDSFILFINLTQGNDQYICLKDKKIYINEIIYKFYNLDVNEIKKKPLLIFLSYKNESITGAQFPINSAYENYPYLVFASNQKFFENSEFNNTKTKVKCFSDYFDRSYIPISSMLDLYHDKIKISGFNTDYSYENKRYIYLQNHIEYNMYINYFNKKIEKITKSIFKYPFISIFENINPSIHDAKITLKILNKYSHCYIIHNNINFEEQIGLTPKKLFFQYLDLCFKEMKKMIKMFCSFNLFINVEKASHDCIFLKDNTKIYIYEILWEYYKVFEGDIKPLFIFLSYQSYNIHFEIDETYIKFPWLVFSICSNSSNCFINYYAKTTKPVLNLLFSDYNDVEITGFGMSKLLRCNTLKCLNLLIQYLKFINQSDNNIKKKIDDINSSNPFRRYRKKSEKKSEIPQLVDEGYIKFLKQIVFQFPKFI